jgi:hypothetical protein
MQSLPPKVGNWIAERTLAVEGQPTRRANIRLGPPQADNRCFSCEYEIEFDGILTRRKSFGVDSLQAVELSHGMIAAEIEYVEREYDVKLSLPEESLLP